MFAQNVPDHCTPTSESLAIFSSLFRNCIPTPLALLSTLLGVLSILSWLCAQVPQIVKNYKLGSVAGLSIHFLIVWLFGDVTNLLGAFLTHQTTWQVVVASYYVCVDLALLSQFVWYSHIKRVEKEKQQTTMPMNHDGGTDGAGDVADEISPIRSTSGISKPSAEAGKNVKSSGENTKDEPDLPSQPRDVRNNSVWSSRFSFAGAKSSSNRTVIRVQNSPPSPAASPKTLLLISMLLTVLTQASPLQPAFQIAENETSNRAEFIGQILSWCSTVLYLGSRLPQIYKNFTRRSTAGLSPTLFIAAFFGNLFYSSSLLTNPLAWSSYPPHGLHGWVGEEGSDRTAWVELAAPFFLGAAGVLVLDAAVGVQFLSFGEGPEERVVAIKDERGRSHWEKVSGWMRGWVPSPNRSPDRAGREEEERLLSGEEGRGERYGGF